MGFRRVAAVLGTLLVVLGRMTVPAIAAEEPVIAECWQGLSPDGALWQECPLGDYIADAVRRGTGADIALIPAGLLGDPRVGAGGITEAELEGSIPVDGGVVLCRLTGPELRKLLEDSVSRWTLTEQETLDPETSGYDRYLQISGFSMRADASALPGDRVLSVTKNGESVPLEDERWTVTAAIPDTLGIPGEPAAGELRALVRDYLRDQGTVELPEMDRVRVVGAHQRQIISFFPPLLIGVVVIFFGMSALLSRKRRC